MRPACLLLTRPKPSAERFAKAARDAGWRGDILIAPLIKIVLHPHAIALGGDDTLILTSQHAVAALVAATTGRDWPVWCVGPGTAQAASAAGFSRVQQSGGDANALLADLRAARPQGPLVHLRGRHAIMDLAGALQNAGFAARENVVYDQEARALSDAALDLLAQSDANIIAPVFSPRSAQLLCDALERAPCAAKLSIVAISDAAARPIAPLQPASVKIAVRPDAAAMLDAVFVLQRALEPRTKPR